jgi:hypothetical protein
MILKDSLEVSMATDRQHVDRLLDHLDTGQLAAVTHLLEVMVNPVARAIAGAAVDDEPLGGEEMQALQESREWLKHNKAISHEQVLEELGITRDEIDRYKEPA